MNPSETKLEAEVSMEKHAVEVPDDPPSYVLIAGDFSRQDSDKVRNPIEVDRDNFDEVMEVLAPRIRVSAENEASIFTKQMCTVLVTLGNFSAIFAHENSNKKAC